MKKIYTELSAGEIVDKLTILQIKKKKLKTNKAYLKLEKNINLYLVL